GEYLAVATATQRGEPLPLRLWHVASGHAIEGIPEDVTVPGSQGLAFSPDGRYLATAGAAIALWELPKGEGEARVRAGSRLGLYRGEAVAFSPDGRYVAAAGTEATSFAGEEPVEFGRRSVEAWEVGGSPALATVPAPPTIRGLALSRGATHLAVIDEEHSLLLHSLTSGRATRVHFSPANGPSRLAVRAKSINLSAKGPRARGRLVAAAFSPRDDLMAMAGEVDAVVWRVSSADEQLLLALEGKVEAVAFDGDERSVVTVHRAGDPRALALRAWDVGSGRELPRRRADHLADAFLLTPTGELVLATDDARGSGRGGSVVVKGPQAIGPFRYEGDIERILLSPDGAHLAVASALGASAPTPVSPGRHQVAVWNLKSGASVLRFDYATAERDNSRPTAFFVVGGRWYLGVDDGETIDGGRRSTFVLWDMKSGQQRPERTDEILRLWRQDLATSADRRWSAVGNGEEIRVLTAVGDRLVARLPIAAADRDPLQLASTVVALSATGRFVAAITAERTVRVWTLDASRLSALACSRLTRDLSAQEWADYLPSEDPAPTCPR
ncbi:MAG TPA: WD40 repeat domain-containing protein, partial [Thermoanaerobaculia bacterium]|nr:WD40 repeat domain-containing protein [Thermoanaerobaculia bacterium]